MTRDMERLDRERPKTARKINRIKDLYWFIHKHGPVKIAELEEEFGMHKRTIERDLETLQYNQLIFSPKRGHWQVTDRKVKGG
jgi:DeoR/GlpR family transcriptional regulator of sugar metabolism